MKTIKNNSFDPFYNLALEEYLLKKSGISEDIFYLWRNKKCVIVGRNQNPFNEVDIDYSNNNDIDILRRGTGGGTVYHDEGNINFTFVTSKITNRLHNYGFFLKPIIEILKNIGIQAKFEPKTHIYVGEHKVSGNAQTLYKNRMIHHGTLLFDVDSLHLQNVLKKKDVITTYAVSSERSKVLNLKDVLSVDFNITQFMEYILDQMGLSSTDVIDISKKQDDEISDLALSKYRSWEWIFGQTPKFTIDKNEYHFSIINCIITKSSHYKQLIGLRFDRNTIIEALHTNRDKEIVIDLLFT